MKDFEIREHNKRPHADIEKEITKRKNGQITFTVRVNAGNIVDVAMVEYVLVEKFLLTFFSNE